MKIAILVPYSPLPADTGAKVEIMKHLRILRGLGDCTILSAAGKPVGGGWTPAAREAIRLEGFNLVLRDETERLNPRQVFGIAYASLCKALRMERAFGHSNPYHRFAFPMKWWREHTAEADLAVIVLSFWAHLPTRCPKAVVLLDLWSGRMWEGPGREAAELSSCDTVVVISKTEEALLNRLGVRKTLWSPPAVPRWDGPLTPVVGMVGSDNPTNIEGLRWIEAAGSPPVPIRVYGRLASHVRAPGFDPVGAYEDPIQPYRDCGVILLTTKQGTGVQIKSIEALAAARAMVERRGAVCGLPEADGAWRSVDSPAEMLAEAASLVRDEPARMRFSQNARAYYLRHLDPDGITAAARRAYEQLLARGCTA